MRTWMIGLPALLLIGCFNPTYATNPDANMGFQCFASDTPACPNGLSCCVGSVCGDQLQQSTLVNMQGWCVVPPPPQDLAVSAASVWDFGLKSTFYTGQMDDPMLTGNDDTGTWRCPRNDGNPADKTYLAKQEPNDLPSQAINYGTLPFDVVRDPPAAYEICPDKAAPNKPDYDAFKFVAAQPSKLVVEVNYLVNRGDLDVGLFQDVDAGNGMKTPQRIQADLTSVSNACIVAHSLTPNTRSNYYYVVVRGAARQDVPGATAMNNYTLRISSLAETNPHTCGTAVVDMGH